MLAPPPRSIPLTNAGHSSSSSSALYLHYPDFHPKTVPNWRSEKKIIFQEYLTLGDIYAANVLHITQRVSRQKTILWCRVVNLEDQGFSLCLAVHINLSGKGVSYQ